MTKKVRRFNDFSFQLELTELNKKLEAYREMQKAIKELEPDANNLEELNILLNKKTKFENPRMSAMAFNAENQYDLIVLLNKETQGINAKDLTKDFKLTEEAVQRIKEKHTEYYTDEEINARKVLDNIIEAYNKLPMEYRRLIGFNYAFKLQYSPLANRM